MGNSRASYHLKTASMFLLCFSPVEIYSINRKIFHVAILKLWPNLCIVTISRNCSKFSTQADSIFKSSIDFLFRRIFHLDTKIAVIHSLIRYEKTPGEWFPITNFINSVQAIHSIGISITENVWARNYSIVPRLRKRIRSKEFFLKFTFQM